MDRSFLSNAEVIKASREFVCIRLATYEDKEEAKFLEKIYRGRSGKLENTVFVLLAPDGKEELSRAGRSPHFAFRSGSDMAKSMNKLAKEYDPKTSDQALLPQMKNVRLGINVGACDGLPSVIVYSSDQNELKKLQKTLAPVALTDNLAGKFIYSSTTVRKDLKAIDGLKDDEPGYYVVVPGDYGLEAKVKLKIDADADTEKLTTELAKIAGAVDKEVKEHRRHVRKGNQTGKEWETEIPVTDPGSNRAMQRRRGR